MYNGGMFGGSMSSIFGEEFSFAVEESKKQDEKKKTEKKESGKKKTAAAKEKKEKKKEKTVNVTLPCTVIGGSFKIVIMPEDGMPADVIDTDELIVKLRDAGCDEVITSQRNLYVPEENANIAFLVPDTVRNHPTADDTVLLIEENNPVTFTYGEQKLVLEVKDFELEDDDETTVKDAKKLIAAAFPCFKGTGMVYDVETNVITPVLSTPLDEKVKLELPIVVNHNGEEVTVTEDLISKEGDVTVADIIAALSSSYIRPDLTVSLVKENDSYFITLKSVKGLKGNKGNLKKNAGAETKKKVEKFPSDCTVVISFNQHSEKFSPEMFGGKRKITFDEVKEYFKPKFAMFASEEKQNMISYFFDTTNNELDIFVASGRKGSGAVMRRHYNASYDYEETEHYNYLLGRNPEEPELNDVLTSNHLDQLLYGEATTSPVYIQCDGPYKHMAIFANHTSSYIYDKMYGRKRLQNFTLKVPKIPLNVQYAVLGYFKKQFPKEAICRVIYDLKTYTYNLDYPVRAVASASQIHYEFEPLRGKSKVIMATIHSHGKAPAFFSDVDDTDELTHIGIFGVIGRIDTDNPDVKFRAVHEGCSKDLVVSQIFESLDNYVK